MQHTVYAYKLRRTLLTSIIDRKAKDFLFCDWSSAGIDDPRIPLWRNSILELPNPIRGHGLEWKLRLQEFPETTSTFLFAKHFLSTLLQVGHFPHHAYPVRLFYYDHPYFSGDEIYETFWDYSAPKEAPEDTYTDDFVWVQLLEYTSTETAQSFKFKTFDPEDGVSSPGQEGLVFPENSVLPPVFKNEEEPFTWWLSEAALEAVTQAQIRGVEFYPNRQITEPKPV